MNKLQTTGVMMGAVALAAGVLGAHTPVSAHQAMATAPYSFTSIASPNDPTFTQLLGINKAGVIAGYFGSGADAQHPNKGFVLNLPSSFSPENYPNSAQTQVIGINDRGDTDGFYIDTAGVTHGFTDIGGTFATVDVPGTSFNQLLGLNNKGEEAGYYQFGPSSGPTFVPFIRKPDGSIMLLPIANAQATGINDQDLTSGFYNDAKGNSHGFLWQAGSSMQTIDFQGAVSTQLLGLNNQGQAVGSYTDNQKNTHGFVYDWRTKTFTQLDAPGAMMDAPGSMVTVVNGINKHGWLVGFFTDANNNTIGFVAKPGAGTTSPSPTSTPSSTPTFNTTITLMGPTLGEVTVPLSFTATVSPNQATGTVALLDNGQQIASGQLKNGAVTFRNVLLASGKQQLSAEYLGSTTFQASLSSVVNVLVAMHF
jgi:uncharacterized membrane protein